MEELEKVHYVKGHPDLANCMKLWKLQLESSWTCRPLPYLAPYGFTPFANKLNNRK